jgi:hypothetical protein
VDGDEDSAQSLLVRQYAHEIFQAWAAMRVARALGLSQSSHSLGARQPAFVGDHFEIFYDTVIPSELLASWRRLSVVPDQLRPDVVVVRRGSNAIALCDAKYTALGQAATEDSRKEVISYMGSFGLRRAGILYPSMSGHIQYVKGQGQMLVEIPWPRATRCQRGELARAIESLFDTGDYT